MKDRRYLAWAVEVARTNRGPAKQHGAVLVKGGNLLAVGTNTATPVVADSHETRHAEVDCFWRQDLKEMSCNLYVARVSCRADSSLRVMDSKPCNGCMRFLARETKVRKVFWTIEPLSSATLNSFNLNYLRREDNSPAGTRSLNYRTVRRVAGS